MIDVDVILEDCPITFVMRIKRKNQNTPINSLLVYSTIQCSIYHSNNTIYDVMEQYHHTL